MWVRGGCIALVLGCAASAIIIIVTSQWDGWVTS
jgi:hypothetical protein